MDGLQSDTLFLTYREIADGLYGGSGIGFALIKLLCYI